MAKGMDAGDALGREDDPGVLLVLENELVRDIGK
jgi:hypothetical protein